MTEDIYQKLAAPFDIGELKFYPGAKSRDGKTARVFTYIDARAVMDRLDASVGHSLWSTTYRVIDPLEKAVECTLSLYHDGQWVAKSDVGYPNEAKDADNAAAEPWKAAYSDALKRAGVQWGIGRYIYSLELERDWLPVDEHGKFIQQPRVKGSGPVARPAEEARPVPQSAAAKEREETVAVASQPPAEAPKGFFTVAHEMGFTDDEIMAESQQRFGNREPKDLTPTERKALLVYLEQTKAKVPAHA